MNTLYNIFNLTLHVSVLQHSCLDQDQTCFWILSFYFFNIKFLFYLTLKYQLHCSVFMAICELLFHYQFLLNSKLLFMKKISCCIFWTVLNKILTSEQCVWLMLSLRLLQFQKQKVSYLNIISWRCSGVVRRAG